PPYRHHQDLHPFPTRRSSDLVSDGGEGVRAKVREMIRAGADVIKIASSGGYLSPFDDPKLPHFTEDEVRAIVETAGDLGRWVMSDRKSTRLNSSHRTISYAVF